MVVIQDVLFKACFGQGFEFGECGGIQTGHERSPRVQIAQCCASWTDDLHRALFDLNKGEDFKVKSR